MIVYRIIASANPLAPASWELYEVGNPIRVYGPANLYDCCRERQRLVDALIHGESLRGGRHVHLAAQATNAPEGAI